MPTPHKHAEVIKAWADGAEIEYEDCGWHDCTKSPVWDEETEYRVKPEPDAPKWPQTTMTSPELTKAYDANKMMICALEDVANAALAHACQAGQLVPADKVSEIEAKARTEGVKEGKADTEERDIAIAINVRAACLVKHPGILSNDELNKIIAAVS